MNKKRKIIIILICLIILLLITHLILFIKLTTPTEVNIPSNNNTYIPVNNTTIDNNEKNNTIPENKTKEDNPNKENDTTTTNNNNNNNNNEDTVPKPADTPTTPTITYTCPDGYSLNGTKCTSTIDANHVCPDGTQDYGYTNISNDTYCVNLSEGYDTDTEDCPDGYGPLTIIGWGTPDTYICLPLHEKIYVCPDDYIKNDTQCTKTIDATIN